MVGAWYFERVQRDVAALGEFLDYYAFTYLLSYMLKPFLLVLLLSKMVFRKYLDELGEQVKSLVKSLFLP